jgi:hypothetical protein
MRAIAFVRSRHSSWNLWKAIVGLGALIVHGVSARRLKGAAGRHQFIAPI